MLSLNYASEIFYNAIRALALGEGDVRSRLFPAYLCFHTKK